MSTHIETVIIGGGQAGLAVSYYLTQQDRPHIVLEQASQAGNACAIIDGIRSPSTHPTGNRGCLEPRSRVTIPTAS